MRSTGTPPIDPEQHTRTQINDLGHDVSKYKHDDTPAYRLRWLATIDEWYNTRAWIHCDKCFYSRIAFYCSVIFFSIYGFVSAIKDIFLPPS